MGALAIAPALMGNVVVFKPAPEAVLAAQVIMRILDEAGLPPGVINMVHGDAAQISEVVLSRPELAGVQFTGSTAVFRSIWRMVGEHIDGYRAYPRLVGETGGKGFVVVHESADPTVVSAAMLRGAFEYQGQKCAAASRVYLPQRMWQRLRDDLVAEVGALKVGDIAEPDTFMGAMINQRGFDRLRDAIGYARSDPSCRIVAGGEVDDTGGWFVRPTVVETQNPHNRLMSDELFGPLLTVYPYPDDDFAGALRLCDSTSPYALTGSILAQDQSAVRTATTALVNAAGNLSINDKPSGATVAFQPFGGGRLSGTNDKAGSSLHLLRWVSPLTIKETLQAGTGEPAADELSPPS
jgi:1-pyrroline-5-carboxylate dehydrogenase